MGTWHLNDLTAAAGTPPGQEGPVAGYVFVAQGTQHAVYLGHRHAHELWWDPNGWHHNDLTAASGAPETSGPGPVGYVFNTQGTQHVVYPSLDNHIHELWWDTHGWHHNDLTAATGAPEAGGRITGYAFDSRGSQHVVYIGNATARIHELWWDVTGWHHNDLTAATGGPLAGSNPRGYVFKGQGTQHVVYQGLDDGGRIHELWWDSNGWHHNDLTAATGAPEALSDLAGYVFDTQGTQHVVYVAGPDAYHPHGVHELWWDIHGWHHNDLTTAAGAPAPSGDEPTGYAFEAEGTQHVVYPGADTHIHELWWDTNGWHHNDLTAATGAPQVDGLVGNTLLGYPFENQGTQHIVYMGPDNHVYELWWGFTVLPG